MVNFLRSLGVGWSLFPYNKLFFLFLGALSLLAQASLLRELTTLFYGNELFYGLGLGMWLLFTGLGSLAAAKVKMAKSSWFTWGVLGLLGFLFPTLIVLWRYLTSRLVAVGELPSLGFTFLLVPVSLAFFCLPLGASFVWGVQAWGREKLANLAYFWETVGFTLAAIIFSFVLAPTNFPLWTNLQKTTLSWRYQGLEEAVNTYHNQLIITQRGGQENFFLSGQLAFTSGESLGNQQLLSLILPFLRSTKSTDPQILIFGNSTLAKETKSLLPSSTVDFLEIDSTLLVREKDLLGEKVKVILDDPRHFFRHTNRRWDLILFSCGNPQTLLANRYLTSESFAEVKRALTGEGIFALVVYLPTDYQSREALAFAASVEKTLRQKFPEVEILIPEEQLLFLSSSKPLQINERVGELKWQNYFWYQLNNPQREKIAKPLAQTSARLNTDWSPVTFYYQQLFWQTIFSFRLPQILAHLAPFLPFLLLAILWGVLKKVRGEKKIGVWAGGSSFILMSLEVLLLLSFQTKVGFLYSQLSLILAAVFLGLAVGVRVAKPLFGGYWLVGGLLLWLVSRGGEWWPIWLVAAFSLGLVGGAIFAFCNRLYLAQKNDPGFIYACDLFGAGLGALLTSSLLLPLWGGSGLLLLLTVMILSILFEARARPPKKF